MKIVPAYPGKHTPNRGAWLSEDGRWFITSVSREWCETRRGDWEVRAATVRRMPTFEQDTALLHMTGLHRARFQTRKAAVAALELALAGVSA